MAGYGGWKVVDLQRELKRRGAKASGRKEDLVERLHAYDRNNDFSNLSIAELKVDISDDWSEWPSSGFKEMSQDCIAEVPDMHMSFIEMFFLHYSAIDNEPHHDIKSLTKGKKMYESRKVVKCSYLRTEETFCITGIVQASMKKKTSYYVHIKMLLNGSIKKTRCEYTAGKGPHATCKHIAAMLFMLENLKNNQVFTIMGSCTDSLQTFHMPARFYEGSPMKSCQMKRRLSEVDDDPRPLRYRKLSGYNDYVRSLVLNSRITMPMRFRYSKAILQVATVDHDYCQLKFTEHWVDSALQITYEEAIHIESDTKGQSKCKSWHQNREWRVTSSHFGAIFHSTPKRDMDKLCHTILFPPNLLNEAVMHGKSYEPIAIKHLENVTKVKVINAGLCILPSYPFLGASPDGFIGTDSTIEVKCPFNGRFDDVKPGPNFPFLEYTQNGVINIKRSHNYYCQIQGALALSQRSTCFLVIYTPRESCPSMLVIKVPFDRKFWELKLLPCLKSFYINYFRRYIANNAPSLQ